jgi:hypothetical protein
MNSKYSVSLLLIIAIFSLSPLFTPMANAQTTAMKITPSNIQITPSQLGSTLQVNVTVENVQNLWQWNASVTWDPAVLNLINVQEGTFLSAGTPPKNPTLFAWPSLTNIHQGLLPGVVDTITSYSSANGTGVLMTLNFTILAVQATDIQLDQTDLSRLDLVSATTVSMTHTQANAHVTVVQPTPSPSPTPTAPSTSPTPDVSPSTSPSASPSPTTSTNPTNSPTSSASTPTPTQTSGAISELSTVYLIVIVGAVMAVLIGVAIMFQRK